MPRNRDWWRACLGERTDGLLSRLRNLNRHIVTADWSFYLSVWGRSRSKTPPQYKIVFMSIDHMHPTSRMHL
jgi:hypothetical protein